MAYSPAFQLYSGDFLSDPHTLVMTTEEIGAYCLLIFICWEQGNTLPNDIDELAVYARLPIKKFESVWEKRLKRCFSFDEKKNIYFHERLKKEIAKQKTFKKHQSEAGKASAEKRKKKKELEGQEKPTTVEPRLNPVATETQPNSSSQSSSSTSVEIQETYITGDTRQFGFPLRELFQAFPHLELTSAQIGMIESTVKVEDADAWQQTIQTYKENFNPALNRYMPDKVGNVLNVFRDKKKKLAQPVRVVSNGSASKPDPGRSGAHAKAAASVEESPCEFCGEKYCLKLHKDERQAA